MKNPKLNQEGQALIELIIFLPLMFMVYAIIGGFANAINGSINQQKVTRGYFYFRVQNNSTVPKPDSAKSYTNFRQFGMYSLGWKDYLVDENPMAPCYKISIPLKGRQADTCENEYTEDNSFFMRVGTVYGLCGATYSYGGSDEDIFAIPDISQAAGAQLSFGAIVDPAGCLTQR